jgi:ABC-type transport system involved in cytochrome c biogenesis permease subunit
VTYLFNLPFLFLLGLGGYGAAAVLGGYHLLYGTRGSRVWARGLAGCALLLHLVFLFWEGGIRGRCPIRTPFELSVFFGSLLALASLLIGRFSRTSVVSLLALPVVGGILALAALLFTRLSLPESGARSFVAPFHVVFVILGYVAFLLTFFSGWAYLLLQGQLKRRKTQGALFQSLPSLSRIDRLHLLCLHWGFLLFTVGLLLGFLSEREGGMLDWRVDPAVWGAALTWLLYAAAVVLRAHRGFFERGTAYLSMLGAQAVLLTYFGIGGWGGGFHRWGF